MKVVPHRNVIKRKQFYRMLCDPNLTITAELYFKIHYAYILPHRMTGFYPLYAVFAYNTDNMNFYPVRTRYHNGEWVSTREEMYRQLDAYNFTGDAWHFGVSVLRWEGYGFEKHVFFKHYMTNKIRNIQVYSTSEYLFNNFADII